MTTFATLLVVAAFGYLIYRYLPKGAQRAFRLDRYHPSSPMSDWTSSYYDDQRRYSDLAAVYGRRDAPDQQPEQLAPEVVPVRRTESPKPATTEPVRQPAEAQLTEYAWRSRRTVAPRVDETRRPAKGVRRLVTDPSTLHKKAS
ncbi:hypothetical protein ACIBCN_32250 [Nocardia sp. NPDC051052]|uniref:hypothetical protein n=1 Tax=Nocardia sp. NPDC051052 TaxID=3364322 RepID=UPI0037975EA0